MLAKMRKGNRCALSIGMNWCATMENHMEVFQNLKLLVLWDPTSGYIPKENENRLWKR